MDGVIADNTRRINELEKCQARIDARLNSISQTLERHTDDSEREMKSMDGKLDQLLGSEGTQRTDMMWGGLKLAAFILILVATSSTAVVMLL